MAADRWIRRVAKPIVFVAALLPVTFLIWHAFHGELGANPLERITHDTGDWTLRFIVMTLAITPVRRLTRALPRFGDHRFDFGLRAG